MRVDCHTHWGGCFQRRDGSDPARWLELPNQYGVTHAIVLPFDGLLDAGKIRQDNDNVAVACARSGGRMVPFCTVNTWFGKEAMTELRRCLGELRFRGIKFHPWLQGQPSTSAAMDDVCEAAADHGVPILFHDGTPPFSLPSQIALLARRHPRTQIVLGHCGLFEHWREAIAAMNYASNLWGCICGPYPEAIRQMLRRCDRTRLLWGSDYGFNFFDAIGYRLRLMDHVGMDDALAEAIDATNPARLLGLENASKLTRDGVTA